MKAGLEAKFREHLHKTVGNSPSAKEMTLVNRKLKYEYARIYDRPDKPISITRASYDRTLSKLWPKVVASTSSFSEITLFLRYTKLKPNYSIASLASGLCVYELFLAKELVPQGFVYCFDISKGMNRKAKALAKRLKQRNIRIVTASATKIPIPANYQNIVMARRPGLSNDKRWAIVLKEARRVLKKEPGSRFIYTVAADFNKPTKNIKEDLEKARLRFVAIERFGAKEKSPSYMIIAKL